MKMLITDPARGAFLMREGETPWALGSPGEGFRLPAVSRDWYCMLTQSGTEALVMQRAGGKSFRIPAPPGTCALCPSPCGRWLYMLGADADAVHAVHLPRGELCYGVKAGVFPRSMQLSPDGGLILVAGGAENKVWLLRTPKLEMERVIETRHPCFGADFCRDGLMLVCAAEGEDIQTAVCFLPKGKRKPRELMRLPGQPGAARVCPDGESLLFSTPDGLMHMDGMGRLRWCIPKAALCMGVDVKGRAAILSDSLTGEILLTRWKDPGAERTVWQGRDARAVFV